MLPVQESALVEEYRIGIDEDTSGIKAARGVA